MVVLLALVPLKDHVIDPFLAKRRLLPSALKQMALGTFFGLASVFTAGRTRAGVGRCHGQGLGGRSAPRCPHPTGILERERLQYVRRNQTVLQLVGKDRYLAATLPVWWQVPQYLLIGVGELFASIPGERCLPPPIPGVSTTAPHHSSWVWWRNPEGFEPFPVPSLLSRRPGVCLRRGPQVHERSHHGSLLLHLRGGLTAGVGAADPPLTAHPRVDTLPGGQR